MSSIFDIFTNNAQQQAAAAQIAGITQGYGDLSTLYGQGQGALTSNVGTGLGILAPSYTTAASRLRGQTLGGLGQGLSLYGQGIGALRGTTGSALGAVNQGVGGANTALNNYYGSALLPWMQNYGAGNAGVTAYGNAVGANGPAGNAAAIQAFQNNPGYQFQLQQGDNAILAQQAATGGLNSGTTLKALSDYNQGLAGTSWNNYVSNLSPYFNFATQGAGGLGNTYTGLGSALSSNILQGAGLSAGLYSGLGSGLLGAFTGAGSLAAGTRAGLGSGLAGLSSGYGNIANTTYGNLGSQLLGSYMGQGNAAYGAGTSIGNANAFADLGNLNASANLWNLGTNLGAGLFGFRSSIKSKEDVEPVGALHDGQTIYRFRYKGDPRHQLGLIAEEVERETPAAVIAIPGDLKLVDYKKATDRAAELLKFARHAANENRPGIDYAKGLRRAA